MTRLDDPNAADITIVGAGPTGGTLALLCAQAGFSTCLIDGRTAEDRKRPDGRNFAIVRGSWSLLTHAGLTGALLKDAVPLNGLEATDGGRHWFGAPSSLFSADDLTETPDGTPLGYMVEATALQTTIDAALGQTENLTWRDAARFQSMDVTSSGVEIQLADAPTIQSRLLVGCDGLKSPVRQAAGIRTEGRAYDKSVFAANVSLSRPHGGIARQLFTPEGPFATLPLSGDRANLAWYMKRGAAEALAALPVSDIEAELNSRFADFAGDMALEGKAIAYPLILQIADRMVAPRVALVGDAARRINPLAGQGLNLGFKDVAALIEVLEEADHVGLDIGSLQSLETYQAWRRFDANTTALTMDAIDRIYSNDNALLKPLRGLALMAANQVGPVRRALARQASADQDRLPKRMQFLP
ncbi:MAG: FAD-dependent monooxygenase [Pseudomonadota bacterium]